MKAQQGVNLGGWLIPEPWLTPSLFAGTGAEDLATLLTTAEGKHRYQVHLKSFMTENDFRWLAEHDITLVRLPVGCWTFEDVDGFVSNERYVDWAMTMAQKYDIQVLLDLHAVRGSQNGEMHSGKRGTWQWQTSSDYQQQTIDVLVQLANHYGTSPSFWGVELVNEPHVGWYYFGLLRFYRRAYRALRQVLPTGKYTVFHDGFWSVLFSGALWKRKHYPVVIDVHLYNLPFMPKTIDGYMKRRGYLYGVILWLLARQQSVIVGEWSAVLPQRYFDALPGEQHSELLRRNIATQQQLYRGTVATMYWNYKAEGDGMWNFRSLVERGDLVVH